MTNYKNYKQVCSKKDYFDSWTPKSLSTLTESLKDTIYEKYLLKCKVFQRDNFTCQNTLCKFPDSPLTMHHVKFKKNGGNDIEKNCITLCYTCHKAFHRGKKALTFNDNDALPKHIRGRTFKLNKFDEINWKQIKKDMKTLRKQCREQHHLFLTTGQLNFLLSWLESSVDYDSWE